MREEKARKKSIRGFTLIELLIVVAIIAILAAIAVPNFLEAQVRAKVSRCKTDMRTCAVAIESYSVDYSRPPIGYNEGRIDTAGPKIWPGSVKHQAWNRVTTPIAYLTSIPQDPFKDKGYINSSNGKRGADRRWYEYNTFSVTNSLSKYGYTWFLISTGPSRLFGPPWIGNMISGSDPPTNIYDATNGTVSQGLIQWTNKGEYKGKVKG